MTKTQKRPEYLGFIHEPQLHRNKYPCGVGVYIDGITTPTIKHTIMSLLGINKNTRSNTFYLKRISWYVSSRNVSGTYNMVVQNKQPVVL